MRLSTELKKQGDFTTTCRVLPISGLAMVIGLIGAFVALGLLRLIGFFTNLFYYQRFRNNLVSPAGNHLGWWAVLVPIAGGLAIGLMAKYGSERIRGHGIPDANSHAESTESAAEVFRARHLAILLAEW